MNISKGGLLLSAIVHLVTLLACNQAVSNKDKMAVVKTAALQLQAVTQPDIVLAALDMLRINS